MIGLCDIKQNLFSEFVYTTLFRTDFLKRRMNSQRVVMAMYPIYYNFAVK
jgi:hypothetical protein